MRRHAHEIVATLSRSRRLAFAVVPSLAVLLTLSAIEVGLRLWAPMETLEVFVQSPWQQDDFEDRHHVRIFEGDAARFWRLKPGLRDVIWDFTLVSTNSQGLRWHRDLGPKPAGALRIVCMGDSVTFGYRVPLAWRDHPDEIDRSEKPYPAIIEERLSRDSPERRVEVVPLAVPGYSSYQGRIWLEDSVARLNADIIILQYGWNDTSMREMPDRAAMPLDAFHRAARTLAAHSQILLRCVAWRQSRRAHPSQGDTADAQPRLSQNEFVENILQMARIASAHGSKSLVLAPIYRDRIVDPAAAERIRQYRSALRQATRQEGIDYLEIDELTERGFPENVRLFGEAIHPNAEGHALMASRILSHLKAQGHPPRPQVPNCRLQDTIPR